MIGVAATDSISPFRLGDLTMMGPKQEAQGALFYEFSIEDHVPQDHLLPDVSAYGTI